MKGLYNNPALMQDRIRSFEELEFEKKIAANPKYRISVISSLLISSA